MTQRFSTCRVIVDSKSRSGSINMALDEVLLETSVARRECSVRVYRWSEATLSLGYFQSDVAAGQQPDLAPLPRVRRLSGGGAILHHHELTYSCALPSDHPLSQIPDQLYNRVHQRLIAMLSSRGVPACMRGDRAAESNDGFLCFGRGDRRDVLVEGNKILGSAQRRRRGAILQHGSLLLSQSPYGLQFPGLAELVPDFDDRDLISELAATVGNLLGAKLVYTGFSRQGLAWAQRLQSERYSDVNCHV